MKPFTSLVLYGIRIILHSLSLKKLKIGDYQPKLNTCQHHGFCEASPRSNL
jgi:hypothetical protein